MNRHANTIETELVDNNIPAEEITSTNVNCKQSLRTLQEYKIGMKMPSSTLTNSITICWAKGHLQCTGNQQPGAKSARKEAKQKLQCPAFSQILSFTAKSESINNNNTQK